MFLMDSPHVLELASQKVGRVGPLLFDLGERFGLKASIENAICSNCEPSEMSHARQSCPARDAPRDFSQPDQVC